jgi:hypothetical protein
VIGFCHRVGSRLVGTLSLLCGDGDAAEELAQETLARVWLRGQGVARAVDRRSCVIVWRSPEPCLADRQAKGA